MEDDLGDRDRAREDGDGLTGGDVLVCRQNRNAARRSRDRLGLNDTGTRGGAAVVAVKTPAVEPVQVRVPAADAMLVTEMDVTVKARVAVKVFATLRSVPSMTISKAELISAVAMVRTPYGR